MGALETLLETLQRYQAAYEQTTQRLIEAERELQELRSDKLVTWDWVCTYLDVERPTAIKMLAEEKIVVYGRNIKRFRRSDIVRFAEKLMIKVEDLEPAIADASRAAKHARSA